MMGNNKRHAITFSTTDWKTITLCLTAVADEIHVRDTTCVRVGRQRLRKIVGDIEKRLASARLASANTDVAGDHGTEK